MQYAIAHRTAVSNEIDIVRPDGGSTFEPQIAFVDIGLPLMDGYDVARHLRDLLGRDVVLVALTGWGQDEDRRRSRDAGFDHHLTKPPDPDVLDQLIAERMQSGGG